MKKQFYESKAMIAGLALTAFGIVKYIFGIEIPSDAVISILTGVGIVGIRDALD